MERKREEGKEKEEERDREREKWERKCQRIATLSVEVNWSNSHNSLPKPTYYQP
jgi:hypothetical protein